MQIILRRSAPVDFSEQMSLATAITVCMVKAPGERFVYKWRLWIFALSGRPQLCASRYVDEVSYAPVQGPGARYALPDERSVRLREPLQEAAQRRGSDAGHGRGNRQRNGQAVREHHRAAEPDGRRGRLQAG